MNRDELLQHLLSRMKREGIGKSKFAAKYKITYSHLSRIFSGKANPGPSFLKKIGVTRTRIIKQEYRYVIQNEKADY